MPKFLYQPLKPFVLNQAFGENKACVPIGGGKVITCDGFNPPNGYKSVYSSKGHTGIDLRAFHGQEVYCICDGVVSDIDTDSKSGLDVRVLSVINGDEYLHIYEHLLGYALQKGQKVRVGQVIGWADNTGYSSGDHLHLELKKNGVSIDPLPLMENRFAKDQLAIEDKILYLKEQVITLMEKIAQYLRDKGK